MRILSFILMLFLFTACFEEKIQKQDKPSQELHQTIIINSIKDLQNLFDDFNYTDEAWNQGQREVPRISFSKITKDWKHTSGKLPVTEKKHIFFRLLLPLVLLSNEDIEKEKKNLLFRKSNSKYTLSLARKYKVIKKEDSSISPKQFKELKKRVDIIPASLALAQGAEESGWGTSRFAHEGNALFGQWDFSGKGMIPVRQRKELGDYGLARFDTPLDSVKSYMLNLNTHNAYQQLRSARLELRTQNKKVTGALLAKTLDKYSEKGKAYIQGLDNMMSFNKLESCDDAYLKVGPHIHLKKDKI